MLQICCNRPLHEIEITYIFLKLEKPYKIQFYRFILLFMYFRIEVTEQDTFEVYQFPKGRDYFTENFHVKENKMKMRNIHPRFFHLLF